MSWIIDRIQNFFHFVWLEFTLAARSNTLRSYLRIVFKCVGATVASGLIVIGGVVFQSNWTIFIGGILLLLTVGLLCAVLIPVFLGVNTAGAIYTRLFGDRT